jgi:hypothetical protein
MKIKLMDAVYHPEKDLTGQIYKLRGEKVTIQFVTGERIEVLKNTIIWMDNQWRVND